MVYLLIFAASAVLILALKVYTLLIMGRNKSHTCLVGKTVLITGANRGIGYETALVLASRGCRLIIADVENAEDAKYRIIEETGNTNVVVKEIDLASTDSVRKFAKEVNECEDRLDILINNAGIAASQSSYDEDGIPKVTSMNHFGHFLLTHLLIGIGLETALALASRGCRLIIAIRSNLEETRQKIIEETGNGNVVVKHLDLLSLNSVRELAEDINKTEPRLDILINNAGVGMAKMYYTEDNFANVMQINHLGPFLLTHLLLDLMKKSAPGRIVFVSSALSKLADLTLDNMNHINKGIVKAYANSKACNNIATRVLAEHLKQFKITVNCLHPGMVLTDILNAESDCRLELALIKTCLVHIVAPYFGKNVEQGAQTTLHVALSKECAIATGQYFMDCKISKHPPNIRDWEFCEHIYRLSMEMLKLEP